MIITDEVKKFLRKKLSVEERIALIKATKNPEILRLFAKYQPIDVKTEVAKNPATPLDVLEYLAFQKSKFHNFKLGVAKNPSATSQILDRLSKIDDGFIAEAIFKNPKASTKTRSHLKEIYCWLK